MEKVDFMPNTDVTGTMGMPGVLYAAFPTKAF